MKTNQVVGIFLIVMGGIFLLDTLGIADISLGQIIRKWWPLAIIVVGVQMVVRERR